MSEQPIDDMVDRVGTDRRTFVRRLVVGTAFATPVVSSFAMSNLSMRVAAAQTNGTSP